MQYKRNQWSVVASGLLMGCASVAANGAMFFEDNFESASAIDSAFDASSTGPWSENYDPKASVGTYSLTQRSASGGAINWALVQVTSAGPGFTTQDPGPAEGNQYLRLAMNDSANVVFMQGMFNAATADDIRVQFQAYGHGSFGIRTGTSATAIQLRLLPATDEIGMPITSVQVQQGSVSAEYQTTSAWTWHAIEIVTQRTAGKFDLFVDGEQLSPVGGFSLLTSVSTFSTLTAAPYSTTNFAYLDAISVGTVPEPSAALAMLGIAVVLGRRGRRS